MDNPMDWERLAVILGTIAVAVGLTGALVKGLRGAWGLWRRLDLVADEILGDKLRKMPSLAERVEGVDARVRSVEAELGRHLAEDHPPPLNRFQARMPR